MYLSDVETVHFLQNAIKWLQPNGYLHIRESCSESSTGKQFLKLINYLYIGRVVTATMHSDNNPTMYRFSSVYTELLRNIRYVDSNGKFWRFNIEWACSVTTYIEVIQVFFELIKLLKYFSNKKFRKIFQKNFI